MRVCLRGQIQPLSEGSCNLRDKGKERKESVILTITVHLLTHKSLQRLHGNCTVSTKGQCLNHLTDLRSNIRLSDCSRDPLVKACIYVACFLSLKSVLYHLRSAELEECNGRSPVWPSGVLNAPSLQAKKVGIEGRWDVVCDRRLVAACFKGFQGSSDDLLVKNKIVTFKSTIESRQSLERHIKAINKYNVRCSR